MFYSLLVLYFELFGFFIFVFLILVGKNYLEFIGFRYCWFFFIFLGGRVKVYMFFLDLIDLS